MTRSRDHASAGAACSAPRAAGLGDASSSASRALAPPRRLRRRSADVAVVGAGFAGLTAALSCARPASRWSSWRRETESAAGRSTTPIGGGEISERGATFAGPTQDHILALAERFGVGKFPTYDDGDNVYVNSRRARTYSDTGPDRDRAARPG